MNRLEHSRSWADRASEFVILFMAVVAPWLFGSVESWARLILYVGVATLTILGLSAVVRSPRLALKDLRGVPSLALLGLALLAFLQSQSIPETLFGLLAPSQAELRAELLPESPERILGQPPEAVRLPAASLSLNPELSRNVAAGLFAAWLLYLGVQRIGGGDRSYRRFALVVTINAVALAFFAMIQSFTWNGNIYWFRPSPMTKGYGVFTGGPFVYHGPLAAYLNLGLGLAMGMLLAPRRPDESSGRFTSHLRGERLWGLYAAGILVFGVVLSQSRAALIAMVGAMIVIAPLARPWRGGWRKVLPMALGAAVVIAVFLLALGSALPLGRITSIFDTSTKGYGFRLALWRDALRAWTASPIWGAGLGTFEFAISPYLSRDLGMAFKRAENEYVDMLVEGGVLGLTLVLVMLGAVAWRGFLAWRSAPSGRESSLILGGLFGLSALALHSIADFSPHTPGLAVTALVLAGHLCRLGRPGVTGDEVEVATDRAVRHESETASASGPPTGPRSRRRSRSRPDTIPPSRNRSGSMVPIALGVQGAMIVLVLLATFHGLQLARAEASLAGSDVPLAAPITRPNPIGGENPSYARLDRNREALEDALRDRPDWAEGYLRLGLTHLRLYEVMAAEWVGAYSEDPATRSMLADPLWLHGVLHSEAAETIGNDEELLVHEPIREHLVPAVMAMLEARRCCPVLAPVYGHLAALDFLLPGHDDTSYIARAERLAGPDAPLLLRMARLAAQSEQLDLAARCWQHALAVKPEAWPDVIEMAEVVLTPDQILDDVIPADSGQLAVRLAERLDSDDGGDLSATKQEARDRAAREALERLPRQEDLPEGERLRLEATALALLGRQDEALRSMETALGLDPERLEWRRELVDWLIAWNDYEEALRQARIGLALAPNDPELTQDLETIAGLIARGETDDRPRRDL